MVKQTVTRPPPPPRGYSRNGTTGRASRRGGTASWPGRPRLATRYHIVEQGSYSRSLETNEEVDVTHKGFTNIRKTEMTFFRAHVRACAHAHVRAFFFRANVVPTDFEIELQRKWLRKTEMIWGW